MPIVTLAQLRGRGRGRRGSGRGGGRGRGRGRGSAQEEAEPDPKRPFQGSSRKLLGEGPEDEEGQEPELGVFAKPPLGTYEEAVEHLQRIQDEAAINALMDKLEAQQGEAEQKKNAEGPTSNADEQKTDDVAKQESNEHKQGAEDEEVIDLCDSDAEEAAPAQPQPKRSCCAARRPAAPNPAVASTSGRGQTHDRPAARQGLRERNRGGQAGRSSSSSSWMFGGEGAYVPDPNAAPDMRLRLNETVQVLDVGLVPHPAHALLDSGNAGCTLIKAGLARQLGLVDASGWPTQARVRTTTVRGVVAGASEKVPLMNLTYELRGKKMHVIVGVTNASLGCDLLISQREISQFLSDGFIFDVR